MDNGHRPPLGRAQGYLLCHLQPHNSWGWQDVLSTKSKSSSLKLKTGTARKKRLTNKIVKNNHLPEVESDQRKLAEVCPALQNVSSVDLREMWRKTWCCWRRRCCWTTRRWWPFLISAGKMAYAIQPSFIPFFSRKHDRVLPVWGPPKTSIFKESLLQQKSEFWCWFSPLALFLRGGCR